MLRAKIKIGDLAEVDTLEYGLVYLDSDKRTGAPTKGYEAVSYPEREGEDILPKSVDAPFDYTVKFFVQAGSVDTANDLIVQFNDKLYEQEAGSDIKTFHKVEFTNLYKRHKIVGYPFPIDMATEFWRDPSGLVKDVVVVEWKIRVTKPSECNFNYSE